MKIAVTYVLAIMMVQIVTKRVAEMEPFIVGGSYAKIEMYPHMAFITGQCKNSSYWICGSSVLNQKMLLTAAHCLEDCTINSRIPKQHQSEVFLGSADLMQMTIEREINQVAIHAKYDKDGAGYDIALIMVREFPLGKTVKRVMITWRFPPVIGGYVAGWGTTCEDSDIPPYYSPHLKHVYQMLKPDNQCGGVLVEGTFCAGIRVVGGSYPARGDSGCALVTRSKIYHQIGLVSYSYPSHPDMTVYTNISYFYNWIAANAKRLNCSRKKII